MHVVVEFLDANPKHRASLRAALLVMARSVLEQKIGCHQFDVCEDDLDDGGFMIYQIFENESAYKVHQEMHDYAEHRLLVDPWIKTRRHLSYELITSAGVA
jgi:(4S)-4-hydroxy-5-phosphonooxypentane-2,3-dione isomerase